MKQIQTIPNDSSVEEYIASIDNDQRRADAIKVLKLMQSITKEKPVMWGPSIVGFGLVHYKYATGREGDTMLVGFSARKEALTLYGVVYYDQNRGLAEKLGKIKLGKGCLYIKNLENVDLNLLSRMIEVAYKNRNNFSETS